jgi:hypothetical protein
LALADSTYAYLVHVHGYTTGTLIDIGWFVAFLGIALGARASNVCALAARAEDGIASLPSLVAPLLPMLLALGVAGVGLNLGHRPDRASAAMALALVVLALVRQALLIVDFLRAGRDAAVGDAADRLTWAALGGATLESGARSDDAFQ